MKKNRLGICSVEGCIRPFYGLYLCMMHYKRFKKHGDPLKTDRRPNGEGFFNTGYLSRQIKGIRTLDHVVIAEKALGKPLPPGAVVHHGNGMRSDNRNDNLVICPDNAYHQLLHRRMRALVECGKADWRKCKYCKQYDDPSKLIIVRSNGFHVLCRNNYNKKAYQLRKENHGTIIG